MMNEEEQIRHYVVPPGSEGFLDELGHIPGMGIPSRNVTRVFLARGFDPQGEETCLMALTFSGDTEPGPSVVCSFPLSMIPDLRTSFDELLQDSP